MLTQKAERLRAMGLSWSEISLRLKIGRSTVRKLCIKSSNAQSGESLHSKEYDVSCDEGQFRDSSETVFESARKGARNVEFRLEVRDELVSSKADESVKTVNEEEQYLPRTFRMFSVLLERARTGVRRRDTPKF